MFDVLQTELFVKWLLALADERARDKIRARIGRLERGLFGDGRSLAAGVSEIRSVVILLCGGDKASQARDIKLVRLLVQSP